MGAIDDYLDSLEQGDRAVIAHIYDVARAHVPDTEQGTGYGMPVLKYRGKPLISVMRAKAHIALYPFSGSVLAGLAEVLREFDASKGTVRFPPSCPPSDDIVRAVLDARVAEIG